MVLHVIYAYCGLMISHYISQRNLRVLNEELAYLQEWQQLNVKKSVSEMLIISMFIMSVCITDLGMDYDLKVKQNIWAMVCLMLSPWNQRAKISSHQWQFFHSEMLWSSLAHVLMPHTHSLVLCKWHSRLPSCNSQVAPRANSGIQLNDSLMPSNYCIGDAIRHSAKRTVKRLRDTVELICCSISKQTFTLWFLEWTEVPWLRVEISQFEVWEKWTISF